MKRIENNAFYDELLAGAYAALAEYEDLGIENIIHIQQDYSDYKQQIETMESGIVCNYDELA